MGQRNGKTAASYIDPPLETLEESGPVSRRLSDAMLGGRGRCPQPTRKQSLNRLVPPQKDEPGSLLFLSTDQKFLIRESFDIMKQRVGDIGVVFFMRLFETHPEVQGVFPPFNGRTQDDLRHSVELRNHGLRVMGFVEKCVARMDQPDKLVSLCVDLGLRHLKYRVPVSYLVLVPPQFLYAIKPAIKEKWTAETEDAWLTLFQIALYYMSEAMRKDIPPAARANRKVSF